MSERCTVCDTPVPHNNKSGYVSKWDIIVAGEAGWFFQKDGTSYCPEHVPEWVGPWRERRTSAALATLQADRIIAKQETNEGDTQ